MNIRRRNYEPDTPFFRRVALTAGDEVVGLTRALLYAASPSVIWTTGRTMRRR